LRPRPAAARLSLPAPLPSWLAAEERDAAVAAPGRRRALQLIGLGLRNEGVREWNCTLRGMNDRQLLAAAQIACNRQVWDRCINKIGRAHLNSSHVKNSYAVF